MASLVTLFSDLKTYIIGPPSVLDEAQKKMGKVFQKSIAAFMDQRSSETACIQNCCFAAMETLAEHDCDLSLQSQKAIEQLLESFSQTLQSTPNLTFFQENIFRDAFKKQLAVGILDKWMKCKVIEFYRTNEIFGQNERKQAVEKWMGQFFEEANYLSKMQGLAIDQDCVTSLYDKACTALVNHIDLAELKRAQSVTFVSSSECWEFADLKREPEACFGDAKKKVAIELLKWCFQLKLKSLSNR